MVDILLVNKKYKKIITMKKLALTIALFTFVALGTSSLQSVIASTTGVEMVRMDDDKKKEDDKKKKSECTTKKSCCNEKKAEKCDDKKTEEKK